MLRRGVVSGLASGFAAGLVWHLVVLGTASVQPYLVPAIGVIVAYGVFAAMRRPGRPAAVVSVAATAVTLAFAIFDAIGT